MCRESYLTFLTLKDLPGHINRYIQILGGASSVLEQLTHILHAPTDHMLLALLQSWMVLKENFESRSGIPEIIGPYIYKM